MYVAAPRLTARQVAVQSDEIASVTLHRKRPVQYHVYALPFLSLYPVLYYAYHVKYDEWLRSEEWTFLYTVLLLSLHALSYLVTHWDVRAKALITTTSVSAIDMADCVRVLPHPHKGDGEMLPLTRVVRQGERDEYSFVYQADKYVLAFPDSKAPTTSITASPDIRERTFRRVLYPADARMPLSDLQTSRGLTGAALVRAQRIYGGNVLHIPVPQFLDLFIQHAVAPFFVFQIFCVGLWLLDEYWFSSLISLFGLVAFECTVVFQRLRTLNEFRTMSIQPFQINVFRDGRWTEVSTSELVPNDLVSVTRTKSDSALPCDLVLLSGSSIVNEAMLSGESTPLLKEGIMQRNGTDILDDQGADKLHCLFGGTKALQVSPGDGVPGVPAPPDNGALAVVLRTGFGTTQGRLIRLMVYTNENQVTANNWESFVFIAFLLVFAIAASAYVWVNGLKMQRPKGKLLLDCVLIITSVVPPELPMELSMAVNASLVALSKHAIFCTEPFRIPYAGRVDVCCFDKTGTITGEDLEVQGLVPPGADAKDALVPLTSAPEDATLVLAAAHALVLVDGEVVGDPMERRALDALGWRIQPGDHVVPGSNGQGPAVHLCARFHFSSALKRMSTVSKVASRKSLLGAVKGAPEVLKPMLAEVPSNYDALYRHYTRRGSRVIALAYRWLDMEVSQARALKREQVESQLSFAGFLVLHCPLKPDAIESVRQLNESSHRCVMITGDHALTAIHVAEEVEMVVREPIVLDRREAGRDDELVWRDVNDSIVREQPLDAELHRHLFDKYDVCVTGAALRPLEEHPSALRELVANAVVYARVSPNQKELILSVLRSLGYITLMAGDGTNDVGALKMANIGVALLDGTEEDMKKMAEHQRLERMKKAYEAQLSMMARWNQPPPPVPAALKTAFPQLEEAREKAARKMQSQRAANPMAKFDLSSITSSMESLDDEDGPPQIRLGDASVAAPFTSKLSNVKSVCSIIRQGRCTLVATIQMYKILALNCLIQAYSLSVLYLDGIKMGDYQLAVSGMLISVCFYCISRGKPLDRLAPERPVSNILNVYVFGSILTQTLLHVATMLYIQRTSVAFEHPGEVDLEAKYTPTLLNSGVYLLSLSQTVSTFAVNYIGRPWRESIPENKALYWGLLGASAIAYLGALELMPELNEWLQLTKMSSEYQTLLVSAMALDFVGSYALEAFWKLFADVRPKPLILQGQKLREARRKSSTS
ncbi:putative cation-transporting ATPase 1 [Malassezia nana]|uniref:Cation-transporting ATPase 1 n=1 Tax=Malassezia nana TaxID=180528 RepID=A0AAF0EMK4_9BASI|nr:putative cation-transporting ATPase 1 [Malassezia nana]